MKTTRLLAGRAATGIAVTWIIIGCMFWGASNAFTADQAAPANLSPGLQEVVKLSQAQMGDNVILAYIKNSGASYTLGADDILYLKSQGVSQNVIAALLQTKSAASSRSVLTASDAASGTTGTSAPAPASSGTFRAGRWRVNCPSVSHVAALGKYWERPSIRRYPSRKYGAGPRPRRLHFRIEGVQAGRQTG